MNKTTTYSDCSETFPVDLQVIILPAPLKEVWLLGNSISMFHSTVFSVLTMT